MSRLILESLEVSLDFKQVSFIFLHVQKHQQNVYTHNSFYVNVGKVCSRLNFKTIRVVCNNIFGDLCRFNDLYSGKSMTKFKYCIYKFKRIQE